MLVSLYPCLRERANFLFSGLTRRSCAPDSIRDLFAAAVKNHRGVAISEDWHGRYAYPLMMKEMMPIWAQMNVTRFYTEMVPAAKQPLLDTWQDKNDDTAITDYFDTQFQGYSQKMWAYYWLMLQAAHESGIRVIGIDKPEIVSGYGANFDAPFKTMHWEKIVTEDRQTAKIDEKFIVYGGEAHLRDMGGALKGIHQHLDIPRILMQQGAYSIASHPFDKNPSFVVRIPPVVAQDPLSKDLSIRNQPVKWGV